MELTGRLLCWYHMALLISGHRYDGSRPPSLVIKLMEGIRCTSAQDYSQTHIGTVGLFVDSRMGITG